MIRKPAEERPAENDFLFLGAEPFREGRIAHLLTAGKRLPVHIPLEQSGWTAPPEGEILRLDVMGECNDPVIQRGREFGPEELTFRPAESGIRTSCGKAMPSGKIRFTGRILEGPVDEMLIDFPSAVDVMFGKPVHTHISVWLVETGDLKIWLTLDHDDKLRVGSIISGTARLKGALRPGADEQKPKKPIQIAIQLGKRKQKIDLSDFPEEYMTEEGIESTRLYTVRNDADLSCFKKALKQGDARAINNLGWMYLKGIGFPYERYEEAKAMFSEAARMGCDTAMVNLGNFYENRHRYALARYWYDAAIAVGSRKGAFNYANMLHQGWGADPDYKQAYQIFRELYDDGYTDGTCFYLGLYAENGFCGPVDMKAAERFYTEGAFRDDAFCCTNLGRMYSEAGPLETDQEKAFSWYSRGAELGDAVAMANQAWMYENGIFVDKDPAKAYDLYGDALVLGFEPAGEACERLEEILHAGEND